MNEEKSYRKITALTVIETLEHYHEYCSLNKSNLKYNTKKILEYFGLYDVIKGHPTSQIIEDVPMVFISHLSYHLSKYIVRRYGCSEEKDVLERLIPIFEELLFKKCGL
jgi:hypothetical protein